MAATFDCAICLDYVSEDSRDYFVTTECGHIFHRQCVTKTFNNGQKKCPICQKKLNPRKWTKLCGIYATDSVITPASSAVQLFDYKLKIIVVGNMGVGKTCLTQRYVGEHFSEDQPYTIGCEWFSKLIQLGNKYVYLSIWDTAGQEKFRSIVKSYYRDVHGALLVYDVTDPASFEALNTWQADLAKLAPESTIKVLIGSKADLREQRQVSKESGEALALQCGMEFFETSAKETYNVDIAFRTLAAKILETNSLVTATPTESRSGNPLIQLSEQSARNSMSCSC